MIWCYFSNRLACPLRMIVIPLARDSIMAGQGTNTAAWRREQPLRVRKLQVSRRC
jgi:hypothetical protein